jgi:hypothetical protein
MFNRPGYMQIWGGFFPGLLSGKPVPPAPLVGTTLPVGGSTAKVIPVWTTDTGHSSVVHVPGLSLVVSGGVVHSQTQISLMGRRRTPAPAGRARVHRRHIPMLLQGPRLNRWTR